MQQTPTVNNRAVAVDDREPFLSVVDLKAHYLTADGTVKAVDGVSFEIQPGQLAAFVGPSGAGKTTIAQALVEGSEDVVFSVSATTRPARSHEVDGVDYHFLSETDFRAMIEADEFVEWAEVHGHLYGTSRHALRAALDVPLQPAGASRRISDHCVCFQRWRL